MRLPLWMGMLSVAGLVGSAGQAFAQGAEMPAPQAVGTAAGHVDPAAKKALEEAAEAVKYLGPCTFVVKMETEGLGNFAFESSMKVKLIRGKTKGTDSYQMVGEFKAPGGKEGDTKVNAALIEGSVGEWIDDAAKTLFIRPTKGPKTDDASKAVLSKSMTPSKAFDIVFLEAEPFKAELAAPELSMEKAATVNGEECQVVKATLGGGSAYRLIYISALDKLPRKYEQYMGKPGAKQQIRRFEVKDLNTESKVTLSDIHLKAPEGYKIDKLDAPPPPPPAPAASPSGQRDPVKDVPAEKQDPSKPADKEKGTPGKAPEKETLDPVKQPAKDKPKKDGGKNKYPSDPDIIPDKATNPNGNN